MMAMKKGRISDPSALLLIETMEKARGRKLSASERAEAVDKHRMIKIYGQALTRWQKTNRAIARARG